MPRLRPTSVSISQSDLSFHLGQLEIYQGLLKQGFNKRDIIRYFKEQDAANVGASEENLSFLPSARAASTVELTATTHDLAKGHDACDGMVEHELLSQTRNDTDVAAHLAHEAAASSSVEHDNSASLDFETTVTMRQSSRAHVPRQSSLLRFAHRPHSSSPKSDEAQLNMHPLSPRLNIKYRQRSLTYSYELSEADEQDFPSEPEDVLLAEAQHLTLGSESVAGMKHYVVSSHSNLRPQAKEFTPFCLSAAVNASVETVKSQDDLKCPSLPSSPPAGHRTPTHVSTSELPVPRTEPSRIRKQWDCSFTVYDDSLPPDNQPRTPGDVDHYSHFNPAYTSPPGSLSLHKITCSPEAGARTFDWDQSPTARAMLLRSRRQREFDRGARIERLRIARMRQHNRSDAASPDDGEVLPRVNADHEDAWRDDLDADRVGEENFDEGDIRPDLLEIADLRPPTDDDRIRR